MAVASLLRCLNQLKTENARLEESIKVLTSRRDHLLAVNARLALPFSTSSLPHRSEGGSPETLDKGQVGWLQFDLLSIICFLARHPTS